MKPSSLLFICLPWTLHIVYTEQGKVTEGIGSSIHVENALFTLENSEPSPGLVVSETNLLYF